MVVRLHPEALAEYSEAVEFYEEQAPGLGRELSFWRASTVSGVLGALLPLALGAFGGSAIPPAASEAPAIVICGLFGAFLGGGLVALGKEARLRELKGGSTDQKLIEE